MFSSTAHRRVDAVLTIRRVAFHYSRDLPLDLYWKNNNRSQKAQRTIASTNKGVQKGFENENHRQHSMLVLCLIQHTFHRHTDLTGILFIKKNKKKKTRSFNFCFVPSMFLKIVSVESKWLFRYSLACFIVFKNDIMCILNKVSNCN